MHGQQNINLFDIYTFWKRTVPQDSGLYRSNVTVI